MPLRLARADGAGHLDRAAVEQQLLGERGLARVGVRDDGEGAAAGDLAAELGRAPKMAEVPSYAGLVRTASQRIEHSVSLEYERLNG